MKRLLFLSLLLISFFSCTQMEEVSVLSEEAITTPSCSYDLSIAEVNRIDFTRMFAPQTKTNHPQAPLHKEITPLVEDTDTLLYVINYGDADGWVLTAADKRMPLIIAMGEQGNFDMEQASRNTSFMVWLDRMKADVRYLKQNPDWVPDSTCLARWHLQEAATDTKGGGNEHEGEWLQLVYTMIEPSVLHYDIPHFLETQWTQDYPWNLCLPLATNDSTRCPAGCVVVAAAQTAYYLNSTIGKPLQAYQYGSCLTYYNNNPVIQLYNPSSSVWATMSLSADNATPAGKSAVSALMGDIGQKAGSTWWPDSTKTNFAGLMTYYSYNSISCNAALFNNDLVVNDIRNYSPVIVGMVSNRPELGGDHAAVIDGMKVYSERYTLYSQWMPIGTYPPVEPEFPDLEHPELYVIDVVWGDNIMNYYRLNWGFGYDFLDNGLYLYNTPWGVGQLTYTPYNILYNFH